MNNKDNTNNKDYIYIEEINKNDNSTNNNLKYIALTTIDNPYDPFDDFTSWLMFDIEKGYNTNGKLARLCELKDEMSEQEQIDEIERAIDRIIQLDPTDLYKKVTKEIKKD